MMACHFILQGREASWLRNLPITLKKVRLKQHHHQYIAKPLVHLPLIAMVYIPKLEVSLLPPRYTLYVLTPGPDDGRVEIRIDETDGLLANQLAEIQLSQQETSASLPPYTSSPLDGNALPPPLNIVIHVVGSRGDVQPFVALGQELKTKYGHRIRLATHGTFKNFVEENGLEFFEIGGDPAELMAFMVKNPGLIPGMESLKAGDIGKRRAGMAQILQGCWKSCADADEVKEDEDGPPKAKPFIANAIIANPPSFAHIHCAEKLGIPLHLMFTYVYASCQKRLRLLSRDVKLSCEVIIWVC
jgi:hypothetical protein